MTTHTGGCHCGNIAVEYDSAVPAAETPVRACQCSFCRKHRACWVSDPAGAARIRIEHDNLLSRYRFGHETADFIVCTRCGVCVCACCKMDGRLYAVLLVNAFDDHAAFTQSPQPFDYDDEEPGSRLARRQARWTPATLAVA